MSEIRCPLREAAEISGAQPALVREGLTLNYGEYEAWVSATAAHLEQLGCREGDRVGIFLHTDWTYPVILLALLRLGAVACPLDVRTPREELRQALEQINCRTLVAAVREDCDEKQLWGMRVLNHARLVRAGREQGPHRLGPRMLVERPATIVFTSGSTGRRKAALHTYGNHYYSAMGSNTNIHVRSGDRWLLSVPLFHVSGLSILFRCIAGGGAVVLRSENESIAEAMGKYEVTHVSLVSTQLRQLLDGLPPKSVLEGLRAVLVGGGAVEPALVREGRAAGLPIFTTYGLTEMASQVTTTRSTTPPQERMTSGQLLPHRELRVTESGEIEVKGETLFAGYVEGDAVVPSLTADGWFATGDVGELDDAGYLHVLGRVDNMFISGGENIHPEEIERILLAQEEIEQAVVVPIPDEEFGARPVAFTRTLGDLQLGEPELRQRLEVQLPRFKHPTAFLPWPDDLGEDGDKPARSEFQRRALGLKN